MQLQSTKDIVCTVWMGRGSTGLKCLTSLLYRTTNLILNPGSHLNEPVLPNVQTIQSSPGIADTLPNLLSCDREDTEYKDHRSSRFMTSIPYSKSIVCLMMRHIGNTYATNATPNAVMSPLHFPPSLPDPMPDAANAFF